MTEPKFTPAPWKVCKLYGFFTVWQKGDDTLEIAAIRHRAYDNNHEIEEANANLISVAPEMYKELEKCAKLLRSYEHHHLQKGDREKAERNAKYAERCEKVLAKARGET